MSSATPPLLFRALAAGLATTIAGLLAVPLTTSAAPPPSVEALAPRPDNATGTAVQMYPQSSVAVGAPRPAYYSVDVLNYVNSYRRSVGAPPVILQWRLNTAAIAHATEMAQRQVMSHVGLNGSNAGARITQAGFTWWVWGEDVAAGQLTARQAATSWYNSPSHRAVMLDRRYRYMGLGRAVAGDGTPYWDLVFASPA